MERLNIPLDVDSPLGSCSIAIQQMVAIARAVDISAKVLILDEPTSSLDKDETRQLFTVMRNLRDQGLGIIFITHFLEQVYEISDRITVLRNGKLVGEYETASLPRLQLISKMIGRELEQESTAQHGEQTRQMQASFLRVENLGRPGMIEPIDLEVRFGEVVGLAGLLGAGRTECMRLIFGIEKAATGRIMLADELVRIRSPRDSLKYRFGFCPEDRKTEAIIPDLSIRENIVLALQARRGWWRLVGRRQQNRLADQYIKALDIRTLDAEKPIKLLSGGNQQKAILARWLATEPQLLMLDEPTRGIDVGAKFEIARVIANLCEQGMAILFVSSELEEVVRICDRVIVLRDRKKIAELSGEQIQEDTIMRTIAG
jgi:simple sugar transport system ATP-binding protein